MNVGPHFAKVLNPDWSINWAEWSIAENQSAGIAAMAFGSTLLFIRQIPLIQKSS